MDLQACLCVEQGILCWVIVVRVLSVRGGTKEMSPSAVMLLILHSLFFWSLVHSTFPLICLDMILSLAHLGFVDLKSGHMSFVSLRRFLSFISLKINFPHTLISLRNSSYMSASPVYSISHSWETISYCARIRYNHVRSLWLKCSCHSNSPVLWGSVCMCH